MTTIESARKGKRLACALLAILLGQAYGGALGPGTAAAAAEVNVAAGITAVTTNGTVVNAVPLSALTDGYTDRDGFVLIDVADGPKWVQLDLGKAYPIAQVNLRNDYNPDSPRTGRDIIIQLSDDAAFASGVTTIFNNDADNSAGQGVGTDAEYLEPVDGSGKDVLVSPAVRARYVRVWSNGHLRTTESTYRLFNTPVEIEVYADPEDLTPPAAVADLTVTRTTWRSADLSWTSPGDDGTSGTALAYDLRYSTSPITPANFGLATAVAGLPIPLEAGAAQRVSVIGLLPSTTYYFALAAADRAGNASALSNVPTVTTPASDPTPPDAVTDLAVESPNVRSVQLVWTAPGDDGMTGTADRYEVRYSTSPITSANWDDATQADDELAQLAPGTAMTYPLNELTAGTTYYIALKTYDAYGNASELSNVVSATTAPPAAPDSVTVHSLSDLQAAIDSAPADGRVITLAAGTYAQTAELTVTNKNNITIQGATGDYNDTVIVGPGINGAMQMNIRVNNSDYLTVKNLTLSDTYYNAIQINSGSDYFRADNLKTWDNGEGGFKVTSVNVDSGRPYADYGVIENCLIGETTTAQRSVVEGIDIVAGRGWVIRGNTFENIYRADGGPAYAAYAKGNAIGTIMENNIVKNSSIGLSLGGGGTFVDVWRHGDTTYEERGGIIRNNIIYNMADAGIYLNKAHDFKVYNNTIMNVGPDTGAIEYRFAESSGDIRNNLTNGAIKQRDGGTATLSHNIVDATDAMFANAAAGDYHLNPAATAAIDQGETLADVPTDIDGEARPAGAAYDIGADETDGNLALNATAAASSQSAGHAPGSATDGDASTAWISARGNAQWISVDLGQAYDIGLVRLDWGEDNAKMYKIQLSSNRTAWTDVYETKKGKGGIESVRLDGASGRFVKVVLSKHGKKSGYALNEIEVYRPSQ